MGLAEATAHLAAMAALAWVLEHVRAREALGIVSGRFGGAVAERVERSAARAADRLCLSAGRLGLETSAAPLPAPIARAEPGVEGAP
jgi:hypothetical protein